jgi:hypothetical protein
VIKRATASEGALLLMFLGLVFAVPTVQTSLEWFRGERVQFTDVFRARPTAQRLRQFEETLKEKSVVQQWLRPAMQQFLFDTLAEPGSQAVVGRDGWWFYRPDLRYLLDVERRETGAAQSRWVEPSDGSTPRDSVVRAIVRFRDQLKERHIQLLVMPVPGKPGIYPDKLTARVGPNREIQSPTQQLLTDLRRHEIETVDLFGLFREARASSPAAPLYLARDTHWTPRGAGLAAQRVAQRLAELGWAPPPRVTFHVQSQPAVRWGDIAEMTQIPGLAQKLGPEPVECQQVLDPALGLLVPTASDRPGAYRYPAKKATVLVLGDSFCRIYQFPEPQSLGDPILPVLSGAGAAEAILGTKRLLPGSAGFVSLLALALKAPVDAIYSDGGASTDVRRKLSTDPEILEGKQVVIWEFVERDIALGRLGWEDVPLPPKLDL